jgi:hypothetical protein
MTKMPAATRSNGVVGLTALLGSEQAQPFANRKAKLLQPGQRLLLRKLFVRSRIRDTELITAHDLFEFSKTFFRGMLLDHLQSSKSAANFTVDALDTPPVFSGRDASCLQFVG